MNYWLNHDIDVYKYTHPAFSLEELYFLQEVVSKSPSKWVPNLDTDDTLAAPSIPTQLNVWSGGTETWRWGAQKNTVQSEDGNQSIGNVANAVPGELQDPIKHGCFSRV